MGGTPYSIIILNLIIMAFCLVLIAWKGGYFPAHCLDNVKVFLGFKKISICTKKQGELWKDRFIIECIL